MRNFKLSAILAVATFAFATAASAVLTTPTAAPDYKAGQSVYFNPAAATTNSKCKMDAEDLADALKDLQDKYKTAGVTPIAVVEQRGTTNANDALTAFRSQPLPDSNVTVFITCSSKGVAAAAYGGKLFQQNVTVGQWQGILNIAYPTLNVEPQKFIVQVIEGAMSQIEAGALAQIQKDKEAAEKAKAEAEAKAALEAQQKAIAAQAADKLKDIESARNGGSHWVIWSVVILVVVGGAGFFFWRRKNSSTVASK